jgi:Protein of unknown function (DUF3347)
MNTPVTIINTLKTIKMIKTSITALVIVAITFTACQDTNTKDEHAGYDMSADTTQPVASADEKTVKEIAVIYTTVDSKAAASLKESVDHYLHIKNALANDNSTEAAAGGKAMEAGLSKMDKSLLTAEQKMAYDKLEEGLKLSAANIAKNGSDIKQQRVQFVTMSESVYELVKNFGAGRPLYHDYCPMAREDQGAMWISEMKEIKNPYFGDQMLTCGTVEEVIK